MGWLRDLMARSTPPVASLGELARLALAHRQWPDRTRIQARSLATLFSKLDRGQELDWLRDRAREQEVIAEVLRLPLLDLKSALGERPGVTDARRLRLRDVRFARELDLAREGLPPGVPSEVTDRTEWSPLIWLAASGAGRGLVSAFLTARGLARVHTYSQTTELRKLPARGALFLELEPDVRLDDQDLEELRVEQRPVCIAAREGQVSSTLRDMRVIRSPKAVDYLSALIDWVRERLAPDSILDPDAAESWIRRRCGDATSLGDLLGMIGLLDEIPHRAVARSGLGDALELLMEKRLSEALPHETDPKRLAVLAAGALTEAAAKTLVETGEELPSCLSLDAWARLLESRATADANPIWLESALRGVDLSARDLRRITSQLPPSGYRLARSLIASSLLCPASPGSSPDVSDRYVLSPYCSLAVLRSDAVREALRLSANQWGRALLLRGDRGAAPASPSVDEVLEELAIRGELHAHEEVIESFDDLSPEHGIAVEASLESLGRATLRGHAIPDELALDTLRAFARVGVYLDGVWEPRFRERGRFFCAFLSLLEHHPALPLAVDPLRGGREAPLAAMAQAIVHSLESSTDHELAGGAWALLFRLSLGRTSDVWPSEHPILGFLRDTSAGRPSPSSLIILESSSWNTLTSALGALEIPSLTLYTDLWSVLRTVPVDQAQSWLERFAPRAGTNAEALWRSAPEALLERLAPHIPFELLLPHQLDALTERSAAPLPEALAAHCPLTAAERRAERQGLGGFSQGALVRLTARFPIAFGRTCLRRALGHGETQGFESLMRAGQLHAVLDELPETKDLLGLSRPAQDALRRALAREVRTPHDENTRKVAFERLTELNRALWPILKASSSAR